MAIWGWGFVLAPWRFDPLERGRPYIIKLPLCQEGNTKKAKQSSAKKSEKKVAIFNIRGDNLL